MSPETLPVCRLGYLFREGMVLRMRNFFHIKSSIKEQYSHLLFFANHHFCIPSHRKCPPIKDIKKLNTMSIVQNLYFADWRGSPPQPKPPPPPHPLPLCLNKQWVESCSDQWPLWTESHLVFLIRKLGLCSIPQEKISHISIGFIINATALYIDRTGWDNIVSERFWEKMNLKIGYLHANISGVTDRPLVHQCCGQRMYMHREQKASLINYSINERYDPRSSSGPRPTTTVTGEDFAFPLLPSDGEAASQYILDKKGQGMGQALGLWKSMNPNDQSGLFQSQLQTARSLRSLVVIMDRFCKAIRARLPDNNVSPAKNTNPTAINTTRNTLRLQTDLPPSTPNYQKPPRTASLGGSGFPKIASDGLPSPIKTPDGGYSTAQFFSGCAEDKTDPFDNMDNVQNKDKDKATDESADKDKYTKREVLVYKSLDVKAIIHNRIRELELKRKREKEVAEDERREREDKQEMGKRCRVDKAN
ncbi:hypothetical protein BKA65DRAFT_513132 [Rhexocercosporidium sp. MPI-PUGE-AT-0058]|nr:hypothetical protein BKA65DRAFT_513132 [Rhexocercosporidium sp. MPI-PUGE-AT-0058]